MDERTGVFRAETDDYLVRALVQQFAKILALFVEKPKLAVAVRDVGGAPLVRWLGEAACPALGAAAFGSTSSSSHRVEYMRALGAIFAVEDVAVDAGREGLNHFPLDQLLGYLAAVNEDTLARAAAVDLLLAALRHPSRAQRTADAARFMAGAGTTRESLSLVWQLAGIGDAEVLATLQRRCIADVRFEAELLGSFCDALGVVDGRGGVDAVRDCGAICSFLRAAGSRPGPTAEEGVPKMHEARMAEAARTLDTADPSIELFRIVLGRCPDRREYLECLLQSEPVAVEAIELLSAHVAAIPHALWSGLILPFVMQNLHCARRVSGGPCDGNASDTQNLQEMALLVRDCAIAFYPLGYSTTHAMSLDLGLALFRCLTSAMYAGYTQAERYAQCAAQVCATHLSQGSSQWLIEMMRSGDSTSSSDDGPVEAAQWDSTVSGAVALALLGLENGDGTGASETQVAIDETQKATVLSTFAGLPLSHKTVHLFTIIARDHRLLAQHSAAIDTLLTAVERWLDELVARLCASSAPPAYDQVGIGGGRTEVPAASPVVILAVDLDMLGGIMEMLRVLVPNLHPTNALRLFDLALKVLALLPAEHAGCDATGYTDTMLEAVVRCIARGGGVARIPAAALAQACAVSGERTRSLLAQLLPEHMLSDSSPMVRAEALRTLGSSTSPDWVQRCGHTVLSACIAQPRGEGGTADAGGGGRNRVDDLLRMLHLDAREGAFEVEQLQLAIAAAPCLAEVAQLAGEVGQQAAYRLAAFSRLSQYSDPMGEPHAAIAAAEQRIPAEHQSIYATQDGIRVGATAAGGVPVGDGHTGDGLELTALGSKAQPHQAAPPPIVMASIVQPVAFAHVHGNDAAVDSPPVLQAVVVAESDASWQGIHQIATGGYVIQGVKSSEEDLKCVHPMRK